MDPRNWSLRARLIALMVALLALTSVVIGGVMFLAVRNALWGQFENDVQTAAQRQGPHPADGDPVGSGYQDAGTIQAFYSDDGFGAGYYSPSSASAPTNLSASQVAALKSVTIGNAVRTVSVPGHGEYGVIALPRLFQDTIGTVHQGRMVVGLPLSQLYRSVTTIFATIVAVVIGAILLAALLGTLIIRRALRPLRRVARVASDVSHMRLESGDVELADRIPAQDTNPHTEVGQVGAALNGLLDTVGTALEKRQASEAKLRTFVADASHELRTPLASIRGYAELTRRFGGPLGEDAQHNIDRIESESIRMTSLVEDLLLLARLDAQRELDEADVDLSRLLVDVVSDAHAAGGDHDWNLELPDEPVIVCGDDARLHQVFTNLLANARVHTPAGTSVTVQLQSPSADTATVLVRDTGPGIPEELQPTLFERFVRGDASRNRNTGSTGLGLSIVSAVVAAHHGTVSVDSRPGETVFAIHLPVSKPTEPVPAPRSTAIPTQQPVTA